MRSAPLIRATNISILKMVCATYCQLIVTTGSEVSAIGAPLAAKAANTLLPIGYVALIVEMFRAQRIYLQTEEQ